MLAQVNSKFFLRRDFNRIISYCTMKILMGVMRVTDVSALLCTRGSRVEGVTPRLLFKTDP
jgi:hypothetical protein